jgi:REP element-mobilizing transposase RayT
VRTNGRQTLRLRTYHYASDGAYFVTICTQDRANVLARVGGGKTHPTAAGRMVLDAWLHLPRVHPRVCLDEFVVMPDHVQGIVWITSAMDAANAAVARANLAGADLVSAPAGRERWWLARFPVGTAAENGPPAAGGDGGSRAVGGKTWATTRAAPASAVDGPRLGDIVSTFKSLTTVLYAAGVREHGWPPFRRRLWQRNYYECIIRDDEALRRIRGYIRRNPARRKSR